MPVVTEPSRISICIQCDPMGCTLYTTALRQFQFGREGESQLARELRYVENLEEAKAQVLTLEQKLADQPGS